jgi:hypothetical protein
VANLATIGSVSTTTSSPISPYLVIGPITLNEDETPGNLKFGVVSKGVTHDLIGGTLVDQSLGLRYKDVTWSGRIYQQNGDVLARIRLFDQMVASQSQWLLKFADERYISRVLEFEPDYNHRNYADYTITVRPLFDNSGRFANVTAAQVSIDAQTTALVQQTVTNAQLLAAAYPNAVPPQISSLQASLLQVSSLLAGITPLASAAGLTSVAQATSTVVSSIILAMSAQQFVGNTQGNAAAVRAAQIVAALQLVKAGLVAGQAPSSVSVSGGTFTALASRYYGDATLGPQLQAANNRYSDALPPGVQSTVNLPPLKATTVP